MCMMITKDIRVANEKFIKGLFFREDIFDMIESLKYAKPENIHIRRSRLIEMFRTHNIQCPKDWTAEQYMELLNASSIPSLETFPALCWPAMAELYKAYRHPKDYISRTVNNLVKPEYDVADSSVQLKILKHFLGELKFLEGTRFFDEGLKNVVFNEYNGCVADIDETIFEKYYLAQGHFYESHKMLEAILEVYGYLLYKEGEDDEQLWKLVCRYNSKIESKNARDLLEYIYMNNHRDRENGVSYYILYEADPELTEEIYEYINNRFVEKKDELDKVMKNLVDSKSERKEQFEYIQEVFESDAYDWHFACAEFFSLVKSHLQLTIDESMSESKMLEAIGEELSDSPRRYAKINDYLVSSFRKYKSKKTSEFSKAKDRGRRVAESFELLKICCDLAEGRFKSISEMKEILYLFAFAFDMTVYTASADEDYDFSRDIRKQLFEDYYRDNIIRYIHNYQANGVYEEPVGITIQYKNFVEVVYLYWLNKKGMSQYEKLMNATNMILEIVDEYKRAKKLIQKTEKKKSDKYRRAEVIAKQKNIATMIYRRIFEGNLDLDDFAEFRYLNLSKDKLLDKTPSDFKSFILENYNIDESKHYKGNASKEAFENEESQNSALTIYADLLRKLKKYISLDDDNKVDLCRNYYLETLPSGADDEYEDFARLIKKINEVMYDVFVQENYYPVTRTKMMIVYYYIFIFSHDGEDYTTTFPDFADEYRDGLNELFDEVSYQYFSEKNLFDMILMYSAFFKLRL